MLRRHQNKVISILISSLLFSQAVFVNASADTNSLPQKQYSSKRLGGLNRIDTSIEIAKEYSSGTLQNVVLATAYNYPDALSGSVLAKKLNAPILLLGKNSSDNSNVLDFIKNHLDANGNIYILGGSGAVSDDVVNSIKALGFKNFTRLGGAERVETNLKIQNSLSVAPGTPVVIATENNFPDAISISSVAASKGYPILLSDYDSLSQNTIDYINSVKPSKIYIVGGTGVISSNVENHLKSYSSAVVRISGADRFETSLAVSRYFNLDTNSALIATGYDFPDAVSGSALAAKINASILLVDSADVNKQKQLLDSTSINNLYILGGNGVISESAVASLSKLQDKPYVQTITGYIDDVHCYLALTNANKSSAVDTKGCLSMASCAASGYGISVLREDGSTKFYFLDGDLSPNATGGQLQAANLIKNTSKKDNISIAVIGTLNGSTRTYVDKNGVSHTYPVLTISSLSETSTLSNISITAPANKLTYTVGDKLDITGLKVTGTYADGTKVVQAISAANVSGFDSSKPAAGQVLTVNVGGKTATYKVNVVAPQVATLNNISITTPANKLSYNVGDTLDITGLQVTGTYSDNSTAVLPITAANVSGFDSSKAVNGQVLTVTVGGKTATYKVNVAAPQAATLNNISITTPANKLSYNVGDTLDITGLQVTGTYSDNSTAVLPITAANVSGFDSSKTVNGQVLTVTVGGKTVTYTVNITPEVVNLTGYIQDEDCFIGYAPNYGDDSKGCLLMKSCAASGYGITALQSDGSYKFYYFDGTFATLSAGVLTPGTGSQLAARNLIQNTTKSDHISIKVTGTLNGDTKTASDGTIYPVITVTSLTEN